MSLCRVKGHLMTGHDTSWISRQQTHLMRFFSFAEEPRMNTCFLAHGPLRVEILLSAGMRIWDCVEASTPEWLVIKNEVLE